jgi:hypothetical protein
MIKNKEKKELAKERKKLSVDRKKLSLEEKKQQLVYAAEIAKLIKIHTGVNVFEQRRTNDIVEFRSLYVHLLREVGKITYHNIRDFFKSNGKSYDHSTALHAYKNYPMYKKYNTKLAELQSLLLDVGKTEIALKFRAKNIIEESEISQVQMFLYMYEKNLKEKQII